MSSRHPLVVKLKSGEYDGADIMQAWLLIESQQAELAELREELKNSWRPIETAPKDREVLLQSAHGSVANGCWCATGWVWPYIHKEPQYWRELLPEVK